MTRGQLIKTFCGIAVAIHFATPALANPKDGTVVEGSATIVQETPAKLTINQHTDKAVIDWKSFSIGQGEHTEFKQPAPSSIALNRVTGDQVSKILGRLSANGQVFLLNPNGVVFGQNSRVDVNGLVATTHDIDNKDFMAGRYNFTQQGKSDARIINQGTIKVDDGGYVALIAPGIENTGYITAHVGRVVLASNNGFSIQFGSDPLANFIVDQKLLETITTADGTPLSALVDNAGRIAANGGSVVLSAHAVRKIADSTISSSGFVEAHSVSVKNGSITLWGGDEGDVSVSGTLDASGLQAGQTGGNIQVTGQNVGLYDGAKVTAPGDAGGGQILIGGDVRGQGSLPNAKGVYIAPTATVSADAITQGNGGKVVAWSDNVTRSYGKLSARGGADGGDGGFIETSSKNYLDVKGAPDASAPKGKGGEWLLDPRNVVISTAATARATTTTGAATTFTPSGDDSIISTTDIQTALNAGTSVSISTQGAGAQTGTMSIDSPIAKSSGGDALLTLTSNADMTFNSNITSTASKLNMKFTSVSGNILLGATPNSNQTALTSNGGTITLNAGVNVDFNKTRIDAGSGDVNATAGVGVKVLQNNSINQSRDVNITAGSYISNLGNGALFADSNPDVKVDRNLALTSPGTSLDFSGNGSGQLVYSFRRGSGAHWARTRELNNMFGSVLFDIRDFTGTSVDFYQTSSNGDHIGFEINNSNILNINSGTLSTLEGQGVDANQIGIENTNTPRETTLYANNWSVDNTLISGPVLLSGHAASTWPAYTTYNGASANTLFNAIRAGNLTPSTTNLGWRSLYKNGEATTVQKQAYQMWLNYINPQPSPIVDPGPIKGPDPLPAPPVSNPDPILGPIPVIQPPVFSEPPIVGFVPCIGPCLPFILTLPNGEIKHFKDQQSLEDFLNPNRSQIAPMPYQTEWERGFISEVNDLYNEGKLSEEQLISALNTQSLTSEETWILELAVSFGLSSSKVAFEKASGALFNRIKNKLSKEVVELLNEKGITSSILSDAFLRESRNLYDNKIIKFVSSRTISEIYGAEKAIFNTLVHGGQTPVSAKRILESGVDFRSVPVNAGSKLYKFVTSGTSVDDVKNSAYWVTSETYNTLMRKFSKDGITDYMSIQGALGLPPSNMANQVIEATVRNGDNFIESVIAPTKWQIGGVTLRSLIGGYSQITPPLGVIDNFLILK